MKIVMLSGSPRPQRSTSMYLLQALKEKLAEGNEIVILQAIAQNTAAIVEALSGCNALVIACPLYVDGVPSNLLEVLRAVEAAKIRGRIKTMVYFIVNNGFYEARQNSIAIRILWHWCDQSGFSRGYAIGVGAGELVQAAPLGHGPSANLGKAIALLAEDIPLRMEAEWSYIRPNFPRFLYKLAAHHNWRKQAHANGLTNAEIRRT